MLESNFQAQLIKELKKMFPDRKSTRLNSSHP